MLDIVVVLPHPRFAAAVDNLDPNAPDFSPGPARADQTAATCCNPAIRGGSDPSRCLPGVPFRTGNLSGCSIFIDRTNVTIGAAGTNVVGFRIAGTAWEFRRQTRALLGYDPECDAAPGR